MHSFGLVCLYVYFFFLSGHIGCNKTVRDNFVPVATKTIDFGFILILNFVAIIEDFIFIFMCMVRSQEAEVSTHAPRKPPSCMFNLGS